MNVAEAGRHYGVARSTIYRWIKEGRVKAERRGRSWFVFADDGGQEADRKRHEAEARDILNAKRGNFNTKRHWLRSMYNDPNMENVPEFREMCRKVARELGVKLPMFRAVLALVLLGCIDQPSSLTEPDMGIPMSATAADARSSADDRAIRSLRNVQTTKANHLSFRWKRPADTLGLVGYEYQIHEDPNWTQWERAGDVTHGEFRPCVTTPRPRTLWQAAGCSHALVAHERYDSLTWARAYVFRVRAIYADSTRGPISELTDMRPINPADVPPPLPPSLPGSPNAPGSPGSPGGGGPGYSPCDAIHAEYRSIAASKGAMTYSGECHGKSWTYFTVDARDQGVPGSITIYGEGEGITTSVCGHDDETPTPFNNGFGSVDLWCENGEWADIGI